MCHSRTINNKINSLHERCLRIIYNDYRSSFEYLLDRDKGVHNTSKKCENSGDRNV